LPRHSQQKWWPHFVHVMWLQCLFFSMRTLHFGHSLVRAASHTAVASSLVSFAVHDATCYKHE
jgi:hypothetical protein